MSQEEIVNRRSKGEDWRVSGDFYVSSGALTIYPKTTQPLIFPVSGVSPNYNFMFSIKNVGDGMISGKNDIVVEVILPDGLTINSEENENWISEGGNKYKMVLNAYDLAAERTFYIPILIDEQELSSLQSQQIPLKSYQFYIYVNYTYSLMGATSVRVVPIELQ